MSTVSTSAACLHCSLHLECQPLSPQLLPLNPNGQFKPLRQQKDKAILSSSFRVWAREGPLATNLI